MWLILPWYLPEVFAVAFALLAARAFPSMRALPFRPRGVEATDGLPDLPVPRMDRSHMAGNHVVLECGPAWVVLAHMQRGTVRPAIHERVQAGQVVVLVGNSGNTGEPHLHLHAQRPGPAAAPLSGEPIPVRIGGRYLVRNARTKW